VAAPQCSPNGPSDYYVWRERVEVVRKRELVVVAKPGATEFDRGDEAEALLAVAIGKDLAADVLILNARQGLTAVSAASTPGRQSVVATAASVVDTEATKRTLLANRFENAVVFHSFGTDQLPNAPQVEAVTLRLPKGHYPFLRLLRHAIESLRPGGRLYVAGANDEGIKSALERVQRLWRNATVIAYGGGGRVGVATKPLEFSLTDPDLLDPLLDRGAFYMFEVTLNQSGGEVPIPIASRPGVFSWDRLDPGTRLLGESLRVEPGERVLDLGCGYGLLGVVAARRTGPANVSLVDVDADVLDCARATMKANGWPSVQILASDSTLAVADHRFDVVVTNPPFHLGRATEYDVAQQFIRDAARVLTRAGRLLLVANRFLPYEATLRESFEGVETVVEDDRYKVLLGRRPRLVR
jgi:16S rRNA (guanine1207-N2)-methyltransferase